jgi:hypothetical protein
MNIDMINQICNTIKNHVNDKYIDKLELFLKIYRSTFGEITEQEKETITNIIKYLNDNNKIKARSLISKIWRFFKLFLVRK